MKRFQFSAVVIFLFCLNVALFSNTGHFVTGPIHTASAWNVNKGAIYMQTAANAFSHHEIFTGVNDIQSGYVVWDTQTATSIYWGVFDHLQLAALPIISQTTHVDSARIDTPADLWLSAQLGTLGRGDYRYGLRLDWRLPLAEHQNIPLHSYAADCNSFAVTTLLSYKFSNHYRLDVNLGGIQHLDKDLRFATAFGDTSTVENNSFEIYTSAALHYFWRDYSFFTEFRTRAFLTAPPPNVYARENSAHIGFGFSYQFNEWIQFIASYDRLLFGRDDVTSYPPDHMAAVQKYQSTPNYPNWKMHVGIEINFRQGTPAKIRQRIHRVKENSALDDLTQTKREKTIIRSDVVIQQPVQLNEAALQEKQQQEREKMHELLTNLRQNLANNKK